MGKGEDILKGIYLWTNLINGKKYVGKSEDIASRKRGYRKEVNKGSDRYIIKALRKYGFENFSFEVIEEVEDNILEREQYWMDFYQTLDKNKGYNVLLRHIEPPKICSHKKQLYYKTRLLSIK